MDYRIERDPLGSREVPAGVYYGIQTLRASENFRISGLVDVLGDDGQRLRGLRARGLAPERGLHGGAHVGREVGGRLDDKLEDAAEECW